MQPSRVRWPREGLHVMWELCRHSPVHLADDVVGGDGLSLAGCGETGGYSVIPYGGCIDAAICV